MRLFQLENVNDTWETTWLWRDGPNCKQKINKYVNKQLAAQYYNIIYRVSHMDQVEFKELLWLCFWCQRHFPPSFLCWKYVYILHFYIWNKKISNFFDIWLIYQIFSQIEIWEMSQKVKVIFFIYSRYQNVCIFPT